MLGRVEAAEGLVPADLMIEAVVEDAEVKEDVFRRADSTLPEGAVFASNTSSIPIASLAAATGRPDRVIGMHFFNPVPVMALVEVVRGRDTSDETAEAITELARELGKTPAVANDFPGFVSNRILMPFVNEAAWALHDGVAEPEAIDTIAKLGFNHPLGPLALADLIGLDTCVAIMEVLQEELGDDRYAPCPLLREHVAAGRLGRKSGAGFFSYDSAALALADDLERLVESQQLGKILRPPGGLFHANDVHERGHSCLLACEVDRDRVAAQVFVSLGSGWPEKEVEAAVTGYRSVQLSTLPRYFASIGNSTPPRLGRRAQARIEPA